MSSPSDRALDRTLNAVTPMGAGIALAISALNLGARLLGVDGPMAVKPLTVGGVVLAALAAFLIGRPSPSSGARRMGAICGIGALLTGALVILAHAVDPQLLFGFLAESPALSTLQAALSISACGAAALLLLRRRRGALIAADVFASIAFSFALLAIVRLLYTGEQFFPSQEPRPPENVFTTMSVNSAVALFCVSTALLFAHPRRGIAQLLGLRGPAGYLMRRVLPAAVLVPLVMGALRAFGEQLGFFGTGTGIALLVTATIVLLVSVLAAGALVLQLQEGRRRAALEALRESERRFRAAFHDAPVGIALVGLDGRLMVANHSLAEIVGYSEHELRGMSLEALTSPEDRVASARDAALLLSGHQMALQVERNWLCKDQRTLPVFLTRSVVRDVRGAPLHLIVQVQDFRERTRYLQAQRLLAEAGQQLAASLEKAMVVKTVVRLMSPALGDVAVVGCLDKTGHIRDVEVIAPTDAVRAGLERVTHLYFSRGLEKTGLAALATDERSVYWSDARSPRLPEGLTNPFFELGLTSAIVAPMTARGRMTGYVAAATTGNAKRLDALDRAVVEELGRVAGLAIDNAELFESSQRATRLREEVLRIVAHDLRNPLNAINLAAHSVLRALPDEMKSERETLGVVRYAVKQADTLIEDLLDVARLQAGTLSVEPEKDDIASIISEVVQVNRPFAESNQQRLEAVVPEELPLVMADRSRVLQVLSNLIGNALKFTPSGGTVRVAAAAEGDEVRVSISDTGPGIEADHVDQVFDPFWQAAWAKGGGAGLGLAIARGVVEAHGGRIWAESTRGEGATFHFTLPIAPSAAEQPSSLH